MSVDIQRVKAFNDELKRYNEKAATNAAEIEFNKREIKRLCDELTAELGCEVTPDNISRIYADRVAKTENTLISGEAILARIKEEELAEANKVDGPAPHVEQPAQQLGVNAQQPAYQQPVYAQQQYQQQPVYPQQAAQGYQIDQFSQQQQQGMPQMQPANGYGAMGLPSFTVGNKPAQTQATPAGEIGVPNLFGNGAVSI